MEKEIGYYWIEIGINNYYISYWNGIKWINPYRSSIRLENLSITSYIRIGEPMPKLTLPINNHNKILQVIRLDGVKFTIGEMISTRGLNGQITAFEEKNNQTIIHFDATVNQNYRNGYFYRNQTVLLQNAIKL